jgi:type I restriction enzyme, S subunit
LQPSWTETAKIDKLVAKKEKLITLLQEKRAALITRAVTKGLDPNVPMKDSGVQWLGEISAHWDVRRSRALFTLFSGFAFKSEYFLRGLTEDPVLITPGNFHPEGGLYFNEENSVHYQGEYADEFVLSIGDQLIVMTDLSYKRLILGRCVTVNRQGLLLNQRVAKIVLTNEAACLVDRRFLSYMLNAEPVREQVLLTASGATVFHSSPDKIRNCWICLPPVAEQQAIVKFIDKESGRIDGLIAKIREGIEQLKEYRTAVISAAVTGKIEVREEISD